MVAYCRGHGFDHLRADCQGPGLALEPYTRFKYGTTFTFTLTLLIGYLACKNLAPAIPKSSSLETSGESYLTWNDL